VSEIEAAEARYKVAEICRLADVQPYVLKYWESEFPVLAAPKGHAGPRLYSARELKIIERIKKLLYDEGYTIAGAKKRLEAELKGEAEPPAAEPEPLVLTAPAPEPGESTGTRRRRAKAAPAPPAEPVPEEKGLELAETPVLSIHAATLPPEPSIPLEIDEAPSPAGDVDLTPEVPSVKTAPVVRKIDPAPAPMAQSPDPRVATALAELKEIARLLSREEA
jgi:DNA-binding transcriptional MerR regulator